MADATAGKKKSQTEKQGGEGQKQRTPRYPTHPLAWLGFFSDRIDRTRDSIHEMLQTPEGIEELKNWVVPQDESIDDDSSNKKIRYVSKLMKKNPQLEDEIYQYTKMREKIIKSSSK